MAKRVKERTYGVDVAKGWLDIYSADEDEIGRIDNTAEAIEIWLQSFNGAARIAVEATNSYHERVAEQAHAQGHQVYVIDAFKLSRYRDAVGDRAKTDRHDAALLARYLQQEHAHLRCWEPQDPRQQAETQDHPACRQHRLRDPDRRLAEIVGHAAAVIAAHRVLETVERFGVRFYSDAIGPDPRLGDPVAVRDDILRAGRGGT